MCILSFIDANQCHLLSWINSSADLNKLMVINGIAIKYNIQGTEASERWERVYVCVPACVRVCLILKAPIE